MSRRDDRVAVRTEQWKAATGEHTQMSWPDEAERLLDLAQASLTAAGFYSTSLRRAQEVRMRKGEPAHVNEAAHFGAADWWAQRSRTLVAALRSRKIRGGITPAEMRRAAAELARLQRFQQATPSPLSHPVPSARTGPSDRVRALLALTPSEIRSRVDNAVEHVHDHGTSRELFRAAASLGPLLAVGAANRQNVRSRLEAAARALHLDEDEARRAIDSGLDAGFCTIRASEL